MSRVGKKPIPIPDKVTVQVKDQTIEVKGPIGTLTRTIPIEISLEVKDKQILVGAKDKTSLKTPLLWGLSRSLIDNMVTGVVHSWKKNLELQGVGYRASKQGQVLNLSLGFSHPINFQVPPAIQFSVDSKQTLISLSGADKELVGITAAKIRSLRPPEPYKGKGVRYSGERVLRKAGKAAGAVGGGVGGKK